MGIFRKKSIEMIRRDSTKGSRLRRDLTALDLTMLGLGAVVGTGIFVLTGTGAVTAGPGLTLSFIIAGITCAFAALSYAEFAALVPVSGSAYTYSYATLGEFIAWIIGWDLILEYLLAVSSVSVGWSGYFQNLLQGFGIELPIFLKSSLGAGGFFNLPAFLIVMAITLLVSTGIKVSKQVNNTMVIIKISVVLLFILVGMFYIQPENWQPFAPKGFEGIATTAAIVFFAYIGFDAIASAAEETKNPQRNLPRGILWSLGIVTLLYVIVSGIMTGVVPYQLFEGVANPVSKVLEVAGQNWVAGFVDLGAILGMMTVMLVMLYGQTRIFYSMSRDGLLPKLFSNVNPRFQTPIISTWVLGLAAGLLGGLVPLKQLAQLVNIGTLFGFSMVSLGVLILRRTRPDLPRAFRCPGVPIVPILAILCCIYLVIQLKAITWIAFGIWMVIGTLIYFLYSQNHSTLR